MTRSATQRGTKPVPKAPQEGPVEAERADTPPDPLAELRDPQETGLPPILGEPEETEGDDQDDDQPPGVVPLVTQDHQDQARAQIVAAWHADTTAVGFLHKGRGCGCSFIAGLALQTVMPVVLEELAEDTTGGMG